MPTPASAQLVAAITANQTLFQIQNIVTPTGSIGFPAVGVFNNFQQPLIIDQEVMYIVQQPTSSFVLVRSRGAEGTSAQPHDALANCYTGQATDFGNQAIGQPGFFDQNLPFVLTIGSATYSITFPAAVAGNVTYNINTTGSPAAITLGTPIGGMNGVAYTFVNNSGLAHVITCTNGINSGSGAQPKSTITLAAVAGAGLTIIAENNLWTVPTPSTTATVA